MLQTMHDSRKMPNPAMEPTASQCYT